MPSIVALDIETTGLDSQNDAILEIGAVRYNGRRIEGEWSTLVNPARHIPEFITQLTGITDEMVRHQPRIHEVLHELEAFVGDATILGHNVRFDLGFLQRYDLFKFNHVVDTYELASVLLPTASRYNLGALGQLLGIPLPATHRALDDTYVTLGIYQRLHEKAVSLPVDILAEIVRLSEPLDWDGVWFFHEVFQARAREPISARRATSDLFGPLFNGNEQGKSQPLQPVEEPITLDPEETAALLEHGGPFSRYFSGYENRLEQVEMLRAVTHALSYGQHLMVEAGTGVGKSFAYLTPAALWALNNNTRVVISTNTINLQDQLIKKDIPDLRAALGFDGSHPEVPALRASVLKGRANYLCPRRLESLRHQGPKDGDEMRVLAKVLVWLLEYGTGDRTDINLTRPAEKEVWRRISAEDDACSSDNCVRRTGGVCPFYLAKQAALNSHLLIVNHALLLADVAAGSHVLPEYDYLIVDEAHHLESATTNALSFRLGFEDLHRMLREVGSTSSGILGHLLSLTQNLLRPTEHAQLSQLTRRASDMAFRLENQARDFFDSLGEFLVYQRESRPPSNYAYQERILPSTRTLPGWSDTEIAWDAAGETLRLLLSSVEEIYRGSSELFADGYEELEDTLGSLSSVYRRLAETEVNVTGMILDPSPDRVYWAEIYPSNNRLTLQAAPIRVGALIEKHLWHEKHSIIMTSATLTTNGEFSYMRNNLNADEADEMVLGSPYDYESSTLLFLPRDIPEPNVHGYQQAVDRTLLKLCTTTGGRTLVLFTSYAQLKRTSQSITAPLSERGIIVYEQGEGASPNTLLETFRSSDRAVLLGTRSFWEGVDIPGEALSVLVIVKLPFDVPSDPLVAARSEMFDDPFFEYHLPEAILRFRQGFGRLIRTHSDRGVVAILDRRVLTKSYGRAFIDSLPACTLRQGNLSELPGLAARWLNI